MLCTLPIDDRTEITFVKNAQDATGALWILANV